MDVIYVLNGGELFREELNAIVAFVGSNGWQTLARSFVLLGVVTAAIAYIRDHDIMGLLKWVVTFTLVTSVLLGVKRDVQVYDLSNPAMVYQVDNVPLGIAGPASIITSVGHGIAAGYDKFFNLPDAMAYNKTGMLFGSNLMVQAHSFQSQNGKLNRYMVEYVKSCMIPDITLNHKYSFEELMHSTDPYGLIFSRPSPLRHIITPGENDGFLVCKDAAEQIKQMMNPEVNVGGQTFKYYSMFFFKDRPNPEFYLRDMLGSSYSYFQQGGESASDVMKKNVTMRLIRQGIMNFAASSNDSAGLVSLSSETAMAKMRMSHRTGYEIATTLLPLLHTILLSLIFGLFPLIIMLATINIYSWKIISGYIYSIAYLMSWPIMFTILNHAMNVFVRVKLSGADLTLSNGDMAMLTRSDLAGVAGWLSLSIPFLAAGIVKGLNSAVSQAGAYMGSAMQSSASASASQATDGNWSYNNMQVDNVNGFKHDTNMSYRDGSITQQLSNNATETQTAAGGSVLDTSSAISRTPLDINFGKMQSAEASRQASEGHQRSESLASGYSNSLNSAINAFSQFNQQHGKDAIKSFAGEDSESTNHVMAQANMVSAAERYGKAKGMSTQDAYQELQGFGRGVSASARVSAHVGEEINLLGFKGGVTGTVAGGGDASLRWNDQKTENLSVEESKRVEEARSAEHDFRENQDIAKSTRLSTSGNLSNSENNSLLVQASTSLSEAHNKFDEFRDNESRTHGLEQMARTSESMNVNQHSNVNQEFVKFVQDKAPAHATEILTDTESTLARREREQMAHEFIGQRIEKELALTHETNTAKLGSDLPNVSGGSTAQSPTEHFAQGRELTQGMADAVGIQSDNSTSTGVRMDQDTRQAIMGEQHAKLQHTKGEMQGEHAATTADARTDIQATDKSIDDKYTVGPGGVKDIQQTAKTMAKEMPSNKNEDN
jgi:conjugal transfer mating pair stabilization protein TraG